MAADVTREYAGVDWSRVDHDALYHKIADRLRKDRTLLRLTAIMLYLTRDLPRKEGGLYGDNKDINERSDSCKSA